ncbi:ribosome-binding factor A [Hymenobacter daecheongensis DSM 21074]|uniref:Ribosome-binding factor A n=1 Tax=Hymenobacter daecheongensis DSM 21074 TaxID=1121955 RepID=A0A1M6B1I2_9BACT|nr:ribosome-binding factor A [Hymenobacter daecheongensis]SHI42604.1 ribosome-binding factor A [Hymenobacter daecheongensis DSM 21074]
MESKRQQKFASLLQQDLAAVFQRDLPHLFPGLPPGISTVRISPDLGVARIYLSALLAGSGEGLLANVQDNSKAIRHALAKRIHKQVRIIPELVFFLDDSAQYAAHMDAVLGTLHIPAETPDAPAEPEAQDAPQRPKLFADEDE